MKHLEFRWNVLEVQLNTLPLKGGDCRISSMNSKRAHMPHRESMSKEELSQVCVGVGGLDS